MNKEIIKKKNWYQDLLLDIRKIEFGSIVMGKWLIGKRILEDELKLGKPEYGSKKIENIARDLDIEKRELYLCLQFAEKCDTITQLKDKSWFFITHELLPEPRRGRETFLSLPEDKYQVIYMDIPWKYDVDLSSGSTRSPENNYPVMDLEEIKEFGKKVKEISADNCVLFMWITAPKLNWMDDVLEAFGFTYKTNLIWDKIKPNMGHYSSVRHEILIIAGKGNCAPTCDGKTIQSIDSVQSMEKSSRHSEKPKEFYEIIEKLYPNTKRIELFLRGKPHKGWSGWGQEALIE